MEMTTTTVVLIIVAVVAIAIALWSFSMLQRSRRLRRRFGPEYDRTVEQAHGKTRRAEEMLEKRQERIKKLHIRPLRPEEKEHLLGEWRNVQERFVDNPAGAVALADSVVNQAMQARNYPMSDFDQRAADVSVEHPEEVQDYRVAHEIAMNRGASTEELRKAMQHYRNLFERLVQGPATHEEVHR